MPVTACPSSSGSSGSKPMQKLCKKQDYTERNIYKSIRPTSKGLFLTDTIVGGSLDVRDYQIYVKPNNNNLAVGTRINSSSTGTNNVMFSVNGLSLNTTGDCNTGIGSNILKYNTTGDNNIAIGANALRPNTTGSNNIAIGKDSLNVNTTCDKSIAIGNNALKTVNIPSGTNSGRSQNIAIGYENMTAATTSYQNVSIGDSNLKDITIDAICNTAIGHHAMKTATKGITYNVGVGAFCMGSLVATTSSDAKDNVAIGAGSMNYVTTGSGNVAVGRSALAGGASNKATGSYNIALGYRSMEAGSAVLSGSSNVGIGKVSLYGLEDGTDNICIGENSGYTIIGNEGNILIGKDSGKLMTSSGMNSAGYNVVIGHESGSALTFGSKNIIIGKASGVAITTATDNICIGDGAGDVITTAIDNICIGRDAGNTIGTGNGGNVCIGNGADVTAATDNTATAIGNGAIANGANSMALGNGATAGASNKIKIGDTNITHMHAQVALTVDSDRRIKKNIKDSNLGLEFIEKLRPVRYNMVNPADYPEEILEERYKGPNPEKRSDHNTNLYDGLIAQEVETALNELGKSWSGHSIQDNGKQALQYSTLVCPLINAVKELSAKNKQLEDRLATLENK